MPSNYELTQDEEQEFEKGGGLKPQTMRDRQQFFEEYRQYAEEKLGKTIPDQFAEDPEILSRNFSNYFWSMQVLVKVQ